MKRLTALFLLLAIGLTLCACDGFTVTFTPHQTTSDETSLEESTPDGTTPDETTPESPGTPVDPVSVGFDVLSVTDNSYSFLVSINSEEEFAYIDLETFFDEVLSPEMFDGIIFRDGYETVDWYVDGKLADGTTKIYNQFIVIIAGKEINAPDKTTPEETTPDTPTNPINPTTPNTPSYIISLDLKELRCNIENYSNITVSFEGTVTRDNGNNGVYVENYDAETDMWYGMFVYYGFNVSGEGLEILEVGNRVKVVGSVQYYEKGNTYQIADVQYRIMKPDDPRNLQLLDDKKHEPSYRLTDPATFKNGKVSVIIGDEKREIAYAEAALYTSVEMKDLKVVDVYTTRTGASKGAMTLTCQAPDGTMIDVRTVVLDDANGELITYSYFLNKTIDVKGIVDYYKYSSDDASAEDNTDFPYQIKLLSLGDVTVK